MMRAPLLPNGAARSIEAALPAGASMSASLRELGAQLDAFVDGASLAERTDGLVAVAGWVRHRDRQVPLPDARALGPGESNPALRRLACFVRLLEISPPLRDAVRAAVRDLLAATETAAAMADTGVDPDRGFVGELLGRIALRVLPAPREAHELGPLLARLFPDDTALARLRHLPVAWFERLATALAPGPAGSPWGDLADAAETARALVATRLEAAALGPRLWPLAPAAEIRDSPFFGLSAASPAELGGRLERARAERAAMETQLERGGVTVARVHALEALERALDRLHSLLAVRLAPPGDRVGAAQRLLVQMIHAQHEARGVRRLTSDALRLLARRIVEGHGRTGEHYIARDRAEYAAMWRAALGGGVLTVGTAALKLRITLLGLAPLPEGMLVGLDYAASFLVMLALHLALATKQPSMTAASLAAIVRTAAGPQRLDQLAEQVAATVRTQLAAAAGNVGAVVAGALALDFALRSLTGHPLLGEPKAEHVVHSFHPLRSGTAPYAALTGVILWASGLLGGWFEHWAIAHRLPAAIAQHPLGDRLGRARLARWGEALGRHASAWGGSVALGLLLGLTPSVGSFVGVPLDVRHVTLSSGMLAFAASALAGHPGTWGAVAWAAAGIAVIFVLNLAVSFLLALSLALGAHGVPAFEVLRLGRKLVGRFARAPGVFLGPPPAGHPAGDSRAP